LSTICASITPSVQDWLAPQVDENLLSPGLCAGHNPDEYLNNDLKQTIKNKRCQDRNDLVVATSSILKSIQKPRTDQVYFHAKHVATLLDVSSVSLDISSERARRMAVSR